MRIRSEQLIPELKRRLEATANAMRIAEKETVADGFRIVRALSLGPFSTATLRKMGHPYARRKPRPPHHPSVINRQTGRFFRNWNRVNPVLAAGRIESRLFNHTPYAGSMTEAGTAVMIGRPILKTMAKVIEEDRMRRLRMAVRKGMRL